MVSSQPLYYADTTRIRPDFVRYIGQCGVACILGSLPSPVGNLLRWNDPRMGRQGESAEGATGPYVFEPGTERGVLLGRRRRGVSPFEARFVFRGALQTQALFLT